MGALFASALGPLLKGIGVGLMALLLYFSGKGKGKDEVTIKSQGKEIKDAKDSQVLKDIIRNKSNDDLTNGLS